VFAIVLIVVAIKMFMIPKKTERVHLDNSVIEQKTVSSPEHGETNNESEIRQ
jgi:short subunit fatty acids transporter